MQIQPYLFFDGRCEEAIEFYSKALDAEVEMLLRYKEAPEKSPDMKAGYGDKIMHACLRVGDVALMMSDDCMGHPTFAGVSLSVTVDDAAAADRTFNALATGGNVKMPLGETFFSPCFGMLTDKFGASWMVIVQPDKA